MVVEGQENFLQSFIFISFLSSHLLFPYRMPFFLLWNEECFCCFCFQNFIHQKGGRDRVFDILLQRFKPRTLQGAKRLPWWWVKDWGLRVVLFFLYHLSVRKKNFLEYVSRPQLADFQSPASCYIVANNILVASMALLHYRFSEMQKIRFVLSFYFRN